MASTVLKQKSRHQLKYPVSMNRAKTIKVPITDAVALLNKRFGNPESEAYLVEELERILVENQIYDLRTNAKMTHAASAKKVGTTAATIDWLENADFEKHPLPLFRKITAVFGLRLELNFVPITKKEQRTTPPLKPPKVKSGFSIYAQEWCFLTRSGEENKNDFQRTMPQIASFTTLYRISV
jgi:transcriptional regulator with XRE-family HTH domain